MAQDFDANTFVPGTPEPPLGTPPKKNNRVWIIILVVVLLLCCCCLIVAGVLISRNGSDWYYQLQNLWNSMVIGLPAF